MGQVVQHRHGGQIQGIAGGGLKSADAPLTQDDLLVALAHNVFCAHQQFLQSVGQSTLEEDGLFGFAQFLQQVKVLHIPGAYLNDVHIGEQIQGGDVHNLGDDGKSCGFLGLQKKFDAFSLHALEGIGGGAGFESAAPEDIGAGLFDCLRHFNDLLFGFHGAGAGNHGKVTAADADIAYLHNGILGVEFPVGLFEWLGNPLDGFHHIQTFQQFHIHPAGISDQSQHGDLCAFGNVNVQIHALQPIDQMLHLFLGGTVFENGDHRKHLLNKKVAPHGNSCGARFLKSSGF